MRFLGEIDRHRDRHVIDIPTTTPDISAQELQPHNENAIEKTAAEMRKIVKDTILDLSMFPSGIHFPDIIFFETGQTCLDKKHSQEGEEKTGKIFAVVNKAGKIEMRRAFGMPNEYGELDLTEDSSLATDQEVIEYAKPLITTVIRRLENARGKSILSDGREKNATRDSGKTVCLTRDLINVDDAKDKLLLLQFKLIARNP